MGVRPDYMSRWGRKPDEEGLEEALRSRAAEVFEDMATFDPHAVRLVEEDVAARCRSGRTPKLHSPPRPSAA